MTGASFIAREAGIPLGIDTDCGCIEGSLHSTAGAGLLLYTDGLTEARRDGELFGLERVSAALEGLHRPSRSKRSPCCAHALPSTRTAP